MDHTTQDKTPNVSVLVNKNYDHISKVSKIQGKHVVIEICEGQFVMNEFSCNDILRKVRDTYEGNEKNLNGAISYRDCKMMLSDFGCVHNIDTRFECLLVRLYPLSCIILKESVLVIVNEHMKMDAFIKDLCRITRLYKNRQTDDSPVLPSDPTSLPSQYLSMLGDFDEGHVNYNFNLPFEICVLECCIITSISHLESELILFENKFNILEDKVYTNKKFKDISILLQEIKHPVSNMNEISRGFDELINEILDSEENIKILEFANHILYYGSEPMKNNLSFRQVNRDLQFLLEYFDQEIDQLCKRTRTLDNSLNHLERYISLELSITRNEMMRIEVMCSILGVSFGVGACLSGLFGMNVINGFENNNYAFIVITVAFLIVMCAAIYFTRMLQIRHRV